jgi:hypothetical protein
MHFAVLSMTALYCALLGNATLYFTATLRWDPFSGTLPRQGGLFSVANVQRVWELRDMFVGRMDQYIGSQILAKRGLPHPQKPAS